MKMKKVLKKHWLILLIVFLIAVWFYWFQWRPTRIRAKCVDEISSEVQKIIGTPAEIQKAYDLFYEACLNRKGLK